MKHYEKRGIGKGRVVQGKPLEAEPDWGDVYRRLMVRIESMGVRVLAEKLGPETTGIFDGLSITTNSECDLETQCHNIGHSFGHIVQWSLDAPRQQVLYEKLYAAKNRKQVDPAGLECSLTEFRRYEEEASQYAAWLLIDTGNADAIPAFTLFARADIEAIVGFHRDGIAPVWREFFVEWLRKVSRGDLIAQEFAPQRIPAFTPISIAAQEVIREVDGLP